MFADSPHGGGASACLPHPSHCTALRSHLTGWVAEHLSRLTRTAAHVSAIGCIGTPRMDTRSGGRFCLTGLNHRNNWCSAPGSRMVWGTSACTHWRWGLSCTCCYCTHSGGNSAYLHTTTGTSSCLNLGGGCCCAAHWNTSPAVACAFVSALQIYRTSVYLPLTAACCLQEVLLPAHACAISYYLPALLHAQHLGTHLLHSLGSLYPLPSSRRDLGGWAACVLHLHTLCTSACCTAAVCRLHCCSHARFLPPRLHLRHLPAALSARSRSLPAYALLFRLRFRCSRYR